MGMVATWTGYLRASYVKLDFHLLSALSNSFIQSGKLDADLVYWTRDGIIAQRWQTIFTLTKGSPGDLFTAGYLEMTIGSSSRRMERRAL